MSLFASEYRAARALEKKFEDAPRTGWVEKGSRAKKNQAITVPRTEVTQMARDLTGYIHGNFYRLYETVGLQSFVSGLAKNKPGAVLCGGCHNYYLPEWMDGKCPCCAAAGAAREKISELLEREA